MKFVVYHSHYGFVGLDGNDPEYTDNHMKNAALFTEESAMRLLVDTDDPRMIIIPLSESQIAQLPFTLLDTQALLDKQDTEFDLNTKESQEMTANAMKLMSNKIDTLGIGLEDLNEHTKQKLSYNELGAFK